LFNFKGAFFSLIFTASDHGPWEIPTNIPFKTDETFPEEERATQYADWSIEQFIEKAKKQKWFDNTVFIFLGDHGGAHGSTYDMDIQFNYIPCVFYCPKYLQPAVIDKCAMQIDVFPTLMGILGLQYENRSMGINLFKESRPYAFFSADDKLGCIDKNYFYYDLLNSKVSALYEHKSRSNNNVCEIKRARSDSMKNYMMAMMQTGKYLLHNRKY